MAAQLTSEDVSDALNNDIMELDEDHIGVRNIEAEITLSRLSSPVIGGYSLIYKGSWNGKPVAVKVLRLVTESPSGTQRKVRREREVWGYMKHPNIVPLFGYTGAGEPYGEFGALISPWYENGDSGIFIKKHGSSLTLEERMNMWRGVVAGVEYLHNFTPLIIHGDLKPANILISDTGVPRLCDFGLARIILEDGESGMTTTSIHTGTDRYLAYELVKTRDAALLSKASDVFALGCIGLYFIYLQLPCGQHKNNIFGQIYQAIREEEPPATRPTNLAPKDAAFWLAFEGCWQVQPTERISASVILRYLDNKPEESNRAHIHEPDEPDLSALFNSDLSDISDSDSSTSDRHDSTKRKEEFSSRMDTTQEQARSLRQPNFYGSEPPPKPLIRRPISRRRKKYGTTKSKVNRTLAYFTKVEEAALSPDHLKSNSLQESASVDSGPPPEGTVMIACDMCNRWYHSVCVGLSAKDLISLDDDPYMCPFCVPSKSLSRLH